MINGKKELWINGEKVSDDIHIGIDFSAKNDEYFVAGAKQIKDIIEVQFTSDLTHQCIFCGCLLLGEKGLKKCPNDCEGLIKPLHSNNERE